MTTDFARFIFCCRTLVFFLATLELNCIASERGSDSASIATNSNYSTATNPWSFQPLRTGVVPTPKATAKTPVDAFIFSKLEENKLAPAPAASRLTLLRRACFDLLGLPPTPEEAESFVRDNRPEAYAELIERLLASTHYGERWGRHWLDVVRYADTGGFEADPLYQNAWRYRDYVIRSFNADKSFDRFIQEQVAGDELWPDDVEAITATALYSIGPVMEESAMVSNQLEYEWLTDAADTTGAAFLGLSVGCARCHDHKYDPIPQKDYFALQAVFAASDRVYPDKVRERRIKALNGLLAEKPLPDELKDDPKCALKTEKEMGLRLVHLERPMEVRLLSRGELSKPREVIQPGFLSALANKKKPLDLSDAPATQRRAALAKWLTSSKENPLPARVMVNRVWAWHFGSGLVRTPNDFGKQGETPSHPELLDWLARDFIEHGWSLKHLHRCVMLSNTYQQSSIAGTAARAATIDPENRLLWHFPRRRLDAETILDNLHACGGTLNLKACGPPVVPPLTKDELSGLFLADTKWSVTKERSEHNRRGVYLFVRRTFLFPMFDAFDPPEVMTSCAQRLQTTVPAQALALLNSKVAAEQSRAFAARLLKECGSQPENILQRAWPLAFTRPITQAETSRATAFLRARQASRLELEGSTGSRDASSQFEEALAELCLALFNANEFIYVD